MSEVHPGSLIFFLFVFAFMADFAIPAVSEAVLDSFSPANRACLKRLLAAPRERPNLSVSHLSTSLELTG